MTYSIMNRIFSTIILALCSLSAIAQDVDLRLLGKEQCDEYLVRMGREATRTFGPEWYDQGPLTPQVNDSLFVFKDDYDMRPEVQRNVGRPYYTVRLLYDEAARKRIWRDLASTVSVWADNGEPSEIFFGNNLGYNFLFRGYREWVKAGVEKEDFMRLQILPEGYVY